MDNRSQAAFSVNGQPLAGRVPEPERVGGAVSVNGETIAAQLIAAEAQNHDAPRAKPVVAWRKAARAVIVRTLLLQEARARSIKAQSQAVGEGRFETEEEALIRGLLDAAITVAAPTDEEVHAHWARDPSRFRAPPLWEVSHILCACDPREEEQNEAARRRAVQINNMALAKPDGFADLARDNSDCGSRAAGGALGQLGPGDTVPEFEAALRALGEGAITAEPVQTRHGWHVIRMDAAAAGAVLPFETVRGRIADAMEKAAWTQAARSFVDQLVAAAEISGIDRAQLSDRVT